MIRLTYAEFKRIIHESIGYGVGSCQMCGKPDDECICEDVNPWAVCTAATGNSSGKKRERCIKKIKKKQGMK